MAYDMLKFQLKWVCRPRPTSSHFSLLKFTYSAETATLVSNSSLQLEISIMFCFRQK